MYCLLETEETITYGGWDDGVSSTIRQRWLTKMNSSTRFGYNSFGGTQNLESLLMWWSTLYRMPVLTINISKCHCLIFCEESTYGSKSKRTPSTRWVEIIKSLEQKGRGTVSFLQFNMRQHHKHPSDCSSFSHLCPTVENRTVSLSSCVINYKKDQHASSVSQSVSVNSLLLGL